MGVERKKGNRRQLTEDRRQGTVDRKSDERWAEEREIDGR
jgi:hypothetical protein